jgi:HTH-type transcriptional regulator/antitoxin HigA
MNARVDLASIVPAWQALSKTAGIGPIRSEAQYDRMIGLLETLLDKSRGARRQAALEGLIDIVAHFIEEYEAKHHAIPDCPPHEMLRYFMERDRLRQSDLPEIGNQGKVSEILAGKRNLNARQIKLLAGRFKVSPAVFL